MKTLTWKDFEGFNPCYDPQEEYGKWEGTILDLLNHHQIPDNDKIWAFTRHGIVSDKTLRLFAVACAREVQHMLKDERSLKALDVAEAFAHGKATEAAIEAAMAAARAASEAASEAACKAACKAAWAAASKAAWAAWAAWVAAGAAKDAAKDAAWDAAKDAAKAAAWDAGAEKSRAKQIQIAIELINKHYTP